MPANRKLEIINEAVHTLPEGTNYVVFMDYMIPLAIALAFICVLVKFMIIYDKPRVIKVKSVLIPEQHKSA